MINILFFIPSLGGGGAEKVLVNLVNEMDKKRFSITVMTLFDIGENKQYLNSSIEYKYIFKKIFHGNIHLLKLFSPEFLFMKMIGNEYDIIISYLEGPTTRIVAGCSNPNTNILNWVHSEFENTNDLVRSYRNLKELKACYKKYDGTVFVSETAKSAFAKSMPEIQRNLNVLYNTVDTNLIRKRSEETVTDIVFNPEKINLISVGRFIKPKGFERLIKIISKLIHNDRMNIHLNLLGQGSLEQKYKSLIKEYKVESHITLLGYKENPYKYVKNSDLFVCSSYYEGYSTAVTESLIVETPVITTLCSGMQELLGYNNEYGIVVQNNDEALYEGLRQILMNRNKLTALKEKAIERSNYFQTETTVQEVEKYFFNILSV